MKRNDITGWLLTTLACGVLFVFWVLIPGCVLPKAQQVDNPPIPPGLVTNTASSENVKVVPSQFTFSQQVFAPNPPQSFTLTWDFNDTNIFNNRSNIMFEVFKCTNISNPQWVMFGMTTNTFYTFTTTNMMSYYRVKSRNIITDAESP
jgi:hypothetical protein